MRVFNSGAASLDEAMKAGRRCSTSSTSAIDGTHAPHVTTTPLKLSPVTRAPGWKSPCAYWHHCSGDSPRSWRLRVGFGTLGTGSEEQPTAVTTLLTRQTRASRLLTIGSA